MTTVIKIKRSETAAAVPTAGALEVGELAMNITDGKFYSKTSGGVIREIGGAGSVSLQDVTTADPVTTNDIVLNGATIIFEGATENDFETTLTAADPTKDNTVTLPDQSGTIAMDGDALAYAIVFGG